MSGTLSISLLRKLIIPQQRGWRKEDAFDAMFALRIVIAVVTGTVFGVMGVEGLVPFLVFIASQFIGANSWLGYQDINIEEVESTEIGAPSIYTEGFGQSLPLFVVRAGFFVPPPSPLTTYHCYYAVAVEFTIHHLPWLIWSVTALRSTPHPH